jgi:hypothetical protein
MATISNDRVDGATPMGAHGHWAFDLLSGMRSYGPMGLAARRMIGAFQHAGPSVRQQRLLHHSDEYVSVTATSHQHLLEDTVRDPFFVAVPAVDVLPFMGWRQMGLAGLRRAQSRAAS